MRPDWQWPSFETFRVPEKLDRTKKVEDVLPTPEQIAEDAKLVVEVIVAWPPSAKPTHK
jgi:hypothetical protein